MTNQKLKKNFKRKLESGHHGDILGETPEKVWVPSECQSTGDTHVVTAGNLDLPSKLLNSQSSAMPTVTDDNSEPLQQIIDFPKKTIW